MSRPVPDSCVPSHLANQATPPDGRKIPRRTWHAASPHKVKSPEMEIPTLQITHFTKKQIVCFEVARIGRTRKRLLRFCNPHDYPQTVELERIAPKKGFFLEEKMWEVPPNSELVIPIFWTPPDEGTFRDLMTLLCEDAFRLQVILLGTSQDPSRKVGGRRSTFVVKKSKPQRPRNPRMMQRQSSTVAGKENSKPAWRGSADVQSRDSLETIGDVSECSKGGDMVQDVGKDRGTTEVIGQSTTNKALKELTNAMEPVQNVPLLNPARETLLVCPGMSPLLKSKKRNAVRGKRGQRQSDENVSKGNCGLFNDQATSKALTELTDASEPIQNVPLQNPARETVLICSGMSPLLDLSRRDVGNRRTKPRRGTSVRRVLNGTAVKNEGGCVGDPRMVSRGQDGRVALKGTEVKVHHSRGEDLGSSVVRGAPALHDTAVKNPPSESLYETDQIQCLGLLQESEVKVCSLLGLVDLSKKALFADTQDGIPDKAISELDNGDAAEDRGSLGIMMDAPLPEKEGVSRGRETPGGHSTGTGDDKEVGSSKSISADSSLCQGPSSESTPEISMMEDSLDDGTAGSPKDVKCDSEVVGRHFDGEEPVACQIVEEESGDNAEILEEDGEELVETGLNAGRKPQLVVSLLEGSKGTWEEGKFQPCVGGAKMSLDSLEGQNNTLQSPGEANDSVVDVPKKSVQVESSQGGSDLDIADREPELETSREPVADVDFNTGVLREDSPPPDEVKGVVGKEENIANLIPKRDLTVALVTQEQEAAGCLDLVEQKEHHSQQNDTFERAEMDDDKLVQCASEVKAEETEPGTTFDSLEEGVNPVEPGMDAQEVTDVKPENQGLVFIPLDEKPKKRSINNVSADRGTKKLKTGAAHSRPSRADTKVEVAKGTKSSSLSLNRTVALRRASATNTAASSKVRAKPRVKKVVKGVPMAKLHLLRPTKTALPRHPMPFAAKNMFYDERWMDKQERGFVQWLNYTLTPEGESVRNPTIKGKKIEASLLSLTTSTTKIQPAPTKEVLSMRAYTARRRLNQLRRCACLLFQSEPVVMVIQKLEAQVEKGGLAVRTDRKIHADLGMKQNILMMILSYNPLWLRIGLETIYGELLPIEDNSDIIGLSRFIVTRLLGNPDIAEQFAHPTVPALFGPGYDAALAKFTLKKFLLLVFFLDKAKLTRLIDHDPCLFCKDAQYKSSRDLLLEFSRLYLKGEGDITRHLNYIGYSVTHVQKALDEYDFAVINLAKDLRDGIRLVRVTELLMKNWLLSRELRCPAISRLQKVHNVQVALDALSPSTNISDEGINAKSVVDGHREKTLKLLWNIIFSFKVETMLDAAQLKEETAFLWKNLQLKRNLDAVKMMAVRRKLDKPDGGDIYSSKSPKLSLLLQWCQAVCAYYDIPIDNFTVSFCDGRAFCYMVHHYHPELITATAIMDQTSQTEARDEGPNSGHDDSLDRSLSPMQVSEGRANQSSNFEQLKKNEQGNFKTLYNAMKSLGGVPFMIKAADMSGTIPDEKVVITYVSYVCARLLDLCKETRAVRTIQVAWRNYKLQKMMKARKVQYNAAVVIQRWIRDILKRQLEGRQTGAVVILQTAVRGWLARKLLTSLRRQRLEIHQAAAAVVIQAHLRGFLTRRMHSAQLAAVLILQASVRGWRARRSLQRARGAVRTIECYYWGHRLRNEARERYQLIRKTAIMIQAHHRGREARRMLQRMRAARTIQAAWRSHCAKTRYQATRRAVTVVQSAVRMYLQRTDYRRIRLTAVKIQAWYRAVMIGRQTRLAFVTQRDSAVTIQSYLRGYLARRAYTSQRRGCVLIQSLVRGYLARGQYSRMREAAITIQRRHRARLLGKKELRQYQMVKLSVVTLQSAVRGWLVRSELDHKRAAVCHIQAWIRGAMQLRRYHRQRSACITIQSYIRAHQQNERYLALRRAVLVIQKVHRGQQTRREVRLIRSAIKIQSTYRMYRARREYTSSVAKVITCQAAVKVFLAQRRYAKILEASKTIQMYFRGYRMMKSTREELCRVKTATLVIQSTYRGHRARQEYQNLVQKVVRCQAAVKRFLARRRYCKVLEASKTIQMYFRGYRAMKSAREELCRMKTATLVIQSTYRGHRTRHEYQNQVQKVVRCQAAVKGFLARRRYCKVLEASKTIQMYFRGYRAMKLARKELCRVKTATLVIQSTYRGHRARQEYQNQVQKVVRCQAAVKRFLARRRYCKVLEASKTIQMYFRGYRMMKSASEELCRVKTATLVIQSTYRGHRARQKYQNQVQKVVRCQAAVKRFLARRRYCKVLEASKTIQMYFRGYRMMKPAREELCRVKTATLVIQSAYRGHRARQEYQKRVQNVVRCQAAVKGFLARRRFLGIVNATLVLQKYIRAYKETKTAREEYCRVRKACIAIQSVYRGYAARTGFRQQVQSVVTCQKLVRGFLARRVYLLQREAAIIIQGRYRAQQAMVDQHMAYHRLRGACIILQAAYRGYTCRSQYQALRDAAVVVQSRWRMVVARRQYQAKRAACQAVQRRWRATLEGRQKRGEYLEMRRAVIVLQSAYRGFQSREYVRYLRNVIRCQSVVRMFIARSRFQRDLGTVVNLQARVRGCSARRQFVAQREAALVLQSHWRATLIGREEYLDYHVKRGGIITIQSLVRSGLARKRFLKMRDAAVCIQAVYRRHAAVVEYRTQREAIITLQTHARAFIQGRVEREHYLKMRASAILIQSHWRMTQAKRNFSELTSATIMVQKHCRMRAAVRRYRLQISAISTIQLYVRAFLEARAVRGEFMSKKSGAISVQAWWRMKRAQREYGGKRSSAIMIQSAYRRNKAMEAYKEQRRAILTLQTYIRAHLAGKAVREEYQSTKSSTVLLQSWWRMSLERRKYVRLKSASITIQTHLRRALAVRCYQYKRASVVAIQRRWRANRLAREESRRYAATMKAVILLQALSRGGMARKELALRQASARGIQTRWRGYSQRMKYAATKNAAVVVQKRYRALVSMRAERESYQELRCAVVLIQSFARGALARRFARQQRGARLIQAAYRMYRERTHFRKLRRSVVKIQAAYRGHRCHLRYLQILSAVTTIQRRFRAYQEGRSVREALVRQHEAAVLIQSYCRSHLARKDYLAKIDAAIQIQAFFRGSKARLHYQRMRKAAVCLQIYWRATSLGKRALLRYHIIRGAAITIQAHVRGSCLRRDFLRKRAAVIILQRTCKGFHCRQSFLGMKVAVVCLQRRWRARGEAREVRSAYQATRGKIVQIQSLYRAHRCRRAFLETRRAAVKIQAWARGLQLRREYTRKREAVVVIQRRWRARALARECRSEFMATRNRIILIQSLFRARVCRQGYLAKKAAAVTIQAWVRHIRCRREYIKLRHAAITVQECWRARALTRDVRRRYLVTRGQIILLQSLCRASRCCQEFLRKKAAAILLQSRIRGSLVRMDYSALRSAASVIQRRWRAKKEGDSCRVHYLGMKSSAVVIQSCYRAHRCREQFLAIRRAAVVVQSHHRGRQIRSRYVRLRRAAVTIQRGYWTALLTRRMREEFELVSGAALRIQSAWRGHLARRIAEKLRWERANAKQRREAATRIQCWLRGRLLRVQFLRLREGALLAQRIYRARHQRRVAALMVIQSYARMWLAKRRLCDMNRAATTIQAVWRGRAVRRSTRSKKIARARARCLQATQAATEDKKLCNRTTSALDFLLGYKYLDQVLEAVSSLEVATRLSSHCCERLVAGQAVPVLYCLIRNCNRSLPCMEVIKHTVATLVNLAKYSVTAPSVVDCAESVTSLLELMMIYRETNPAIATRTAVLLTILGQHEEIKKIILATPKMDEKLRSLRYLHERKQKLRTQQRIAKSRTKGLGLTPSATPSKKARPRRQFQPDWVLGRDKRPEASDPLEAIKCLNNILGVK